MDRALKFSLVSLLVLVSVSAQAQEAKMLLPERTELKAGQLAVTFGETVRESDARTLIAKQGYRIIKNNFSSVLVWAGRDSALSSEDVGRIQKQPGVLSVTQFDWRQMLGRAAPALVDSVFLTPPPQVKWPIPQGQHNVIIRFVSSLTERDVRRILEIVRDLEIRGINKRINELIIQVPSGTEELATEKLKKSRLVQEVYHIMKD